MPYWFLDKEKNEPRIFGSLPVLCKSTGLEYPKMQYRFRNNEKYEDESVRIEKLPLERSSTSE